METIQKTSLTSKSRGLFIDFLVSALEQNNKNKETVFLTIRLIDRYLSRFQILENELSLLGATCFFIASKITETTEVTISFVSGLFQRIFPSKRLIQAECQVLNGLEFNTTFYSSFSFLVIFKDLLKFSQQVFDIAEIALEISLLNFTLLKVPQSELASAAILLSLAFLGENSSWRELNYEEATGFSQEKLAPVANHLYETLQLCWSDADNLRVMRHFKNHPNFYPISVVLKRGERPPERAFE